MNTVSAEETAFPVFNSEQTEAVARVADLVCFADGEELISQGAKNFPFYVVASGSVRIIERFEEEELEIARHGPGEFTGDVDMLTGRSAVITAVADGEVTAYRMCGALLRRILGECPDVGDMLLNAFQIRRAILEESDFVGVRVVGQLNTPETSQLIEFFYKNNVPFTFRESECSDARKELLSLEAQDMELPVVHCNGHTLSNPHIADVARCIGISRSVDQEFYDLVIVGSGPAGLAAAVYSASEGIRTLVVDAIGPGGQAGSSSKIENFIGFPSGLSGNELANRGYLQALKFGAEFVAPIRVESLVRHSPQELHLNLSNGELVRAACVLVATGVNYKDLKVPGYKRLEGAGVYYAATSAEARVCLDETAIVVGGGNSAGQAAMFLANSARRVVMLIRGESLSQSMSSYLSERVLNHENIEVRWNTEVLEIHGEDSVEAVTVKRKEDGERQRIDCSAVFTFIGAKPYTDWLPEEILLDEQGYVATGSLLSIGEFQARWDLERQPCDLETTMPGVLAAGDVRAGTTKRCGFAVGDGSLAVTCVHRYLGTI